MKEAACFWLILEGIYRTMHSFAYSESCFLTGLCLEGRMVFVFQLKRTSSLKCHSVILVSVYGIPFFGELCSTHITHYLSFLWCIFKVPVSLITNEEVFTRYLSFLRCIFTVLVVILITNEEVFTLKILRLGTHTWPGNGRARS